MNKKSLIKFIKPSKNGLLLFILGLSSVFLFAPFYLFFLGFFILPIFALILFRSKSLIVFYHYSFYFFFGFYFSNFYWISFSFLTNQNYLYFFPLVFFLIPILLALSSLLLITLLPYIKFKYKLNLAEFYFFFCFFYFLHEILRSNIILFVDLQGLPWNLLGYSFFNYPALVQSASIYGVYGLTLIAIYLFTLPLLINQLKKFKYFILATLLIIPFFIILTYYGNYHMSKKLAPKNSKLQISIIHSNIAKHHGFNQNIIKENIDKIISNINDSGKSNLAIFAEGIVPQVTSENYNPVFDYIIEHTAHKYDNLIISSPRAKLAGEYKFYNSMFLINNQKKIKQYYDKINLVPFGEYNPFFRSIPSLASQSGFSEGNKTKSLLNITNEVAAIPLICYDGIFSGSFSQDGDFLLNITNDIWFTKKFSSFNLSVAPWQHFDLIRMRAIEEGKPLIRVANYGISAATDSFGRILTKITHNDFDKVLQIELPQKLAKASIFNQYRNLPIYLLALTIILILALYLIQIKKTRL
ncbi:MAG: apolipoprotein N-acyltransferase [Rickettsiales bacterium]